ncbi:MAG: class I adenylate-forming enzyme family protein [Lachnospiraceae bacterium]|jgi:fatty-acyl-CoA synthase
MACFVDDYRVVNVKVQENDNLILEAVFDCRGKALSLVSTPYDEEVFLCAKKLAEENTGVSGTFEEEILCGERKLRAVCERYINFTLGDLIGIQAERYSDRVMISDVLGKTTVTYAQAGDMARSLAKALINRGIKRGEHVAIIMNNCWEQIISKFAVAMAGAVVDNVSYHEKKSGLESQMRDDNIVCAIIKQGIPNKEHMDLFYQIDPQLLYQKADELTTEKLPDLRFLIVTDKTHPRAATLKFTDLINEGTSLPDDLLKERRKEIKCHDYASIIHTSGSTGKPKSVLLKHYQLIENAVSHVEKMQMTENDILCMTPPMFHAFGAVGSMLTTIVAGGRVVCYDSAGSVPLIDVLRNENITVLCSVPIIYVRLLDTIRSKNISMKESSLRLCVTAGAPCPPVLVEDICRELGVDSVVGMYGMTETSPGLSSHTPGDSVDVICNTVGKFWPGVEYKITNPEDGLPMPEGEAGEICVRGYMVMDGYYKNPDETAKIIDPEGWVHTGDLGFVREDGNLVLKGRIKDLIIRGGENISPMEVESCIKRHDAIDNVAVVGAPDPEFGEKVCAYIVLKEGMKVSSDELKKWCRGKIATIKIPQVIEIIDEFPALPSGKVDKKTLKKMAENI